MMKDQLDGLLALKLVADRRSFTAAATALRISPSAISQIIKQLENRLGIALLTRTTRSMSLAEAGERFLAQAGPAIEQILTAWKISAATQQTLRAGEDQPAARRLSSYLAPVLTSFIEKHPDITVELCFEDGQTDIVGSGFDAGIRLSDILAQDMIATEALRPGALRDGRRAPLPGSHAVARNTRRTC